MQLFYRWATLGFIICLSFACNAFRPPVITNSKLFGDGVSQGKLDYDKVDEASGIIASRKYPGYFWIHNDSGGDAALYLFDSTAAFTGKLVLENALNIDWEDIAYGPCPDGNCIYVGDIGDNFSAREEIQIYYFKEPELSFDLLPFTKSIQSYKIELKYPDGARDAESLIVDPVSGTLIIFTKREKNIRVYGLVNPIAGKQELVFHNNLPYTMITGADVSPDGKELLIKSYSEVFYWQIDHDLIRTIQDELPEKLAYKIEPQGEAICFDLSNKGYYTVSEERKDIEARLLFYPRLTSK